MKKSRVGISVVAAAVCLVFTAGTASAAPAGFPGPVSGVTGVTTIALNPSTVQALASSGVTLQPVSPGAVWPVGLVSFPVTSSSLTTNPLGGTIDHSGGVTFVDKSTGKSVEIEDFDITLSPSPVLTAYVPAIGSRQPVFDLNLSHAQVWSFGPLTTISNVGLSLDPIAAAGLGGGLSDPAFTSGLNFGTAGSVYIG